MYFSSLAVAVVCLVAVGLVEAHTVITYPGWRGNNLITNDTFPYGMQWMYPCKYLESCCFSAGDGQAWGRASESPAAEKADIYLSLKPLPPPLHHLFSLLHLNHLSHTSN